MYTHVHTHPPTNRPPLSESVTRGASSQRLASSPPHNKTTASYSNVVDNAAPVTQTGSERRANVARLKSELAPRDEPGLRPSLRIAQRSSKAKQMASEERGDHDGELAVCEQERVIGRAVWRVAQRESHDLSDEEWHVKKYKIKSLCVRKSYTQSHTQ